MAGRKAVKAINWSALIERVPESERNAFLNFKSKSEKYLKRVMEYPESQPKLDWAFYKKNIALPGLVDKFQKEYESLKIPFPQDSYSSQIESEEKKVLANVQNFINESNKRIEDSKNEVKKLQGMLKYSQMTMQDFADAHPEQALDNINRPTIYPHLPEYQPGPDDDKEVSHH